MMDTVEKGDGRPKEMDKYKNLKWIIKGKNI